MLLNNCEIWNLTKKLEESLDIFQYSRQVKAYIFINGAVDMSFYNTD